MEPYIDATVSMMESTRAHARSLMETTAAGSKTAPKQMQGAVGCCSYNGCTCVSTGINCNAVATGCSSRKGPADNGSSEPSIDTTVSMMESTAAGSKTAP